MRTRLESGKIIAFPEGRIDSGNAPAVHQALKNCMAENPGQTLELDMGDVSYISSAGLRVLMQIRKAQGGLAVVNVSPEVYDVLQITGFTDLLTVKRRLRQVSVEGCPIVGRGAIGTVYRLDEDTIVKVYEIPNSMSMIENEQKRAKQAFLKGIPTAISYDIVRVGDKYGSVFEMLQATTFNDMIIQHPERRDEIIRRYAALIRQLHAVEMEKGELPDARGVFLGYLDELRDTIPDGPRGRLRALLEAMPENLHVVHGDIQMKNVMLSGDEPLLIDMDTLSAGDPVFDLMGIYISYVLFNEDDPTDTERFLGIPEDVANEIWAGTLRRYFEGLDEGALKAMEDRIILLAQVRFLYLIAVLNIDVPALKQPRIQHALAHIDALIDRVDSLAVGSTIA